MAKATFAASIQAKSGRLYAVIQVKTGKATKPVWRALGLDEDASKSTVNKRFREVVTNFEEEYAELLERVNRPDSEIPIYEYLKEFVERIKPNIQYNTYVSYHGMVEGKIKRYFEENPHLTIGNITAKEIERFYTHLFSFGVKSNTVIHYHAVLHSAFKQAFKDDLIIANPFDKVTRPKKNEFQGSFYSKEEMQKLLELAKDDPIYTAIMVSGTMGLRRSETLGVRWSRIDWEAKTLLLDTKVIEKKINGKKVPVPVEVMKNKSSKRTMAASAPFCGPNTAAAPLGPQSGFSISHMTVTRTSFRNSAHADESIRQISFSVEPTGMNSSSLSLKNFTPIAAAAPQAPSFVELPPRPRIICFAPFSTACRISSPTP